MIRYTSFLTWLDSDLSGGLWPYLRNDRRLGSVQGRLNLREIFGDINQVLESRLSVLPQIRFRRYVFFQIKSQRGV